MSDATEIGTTGAGLRVARVVVRCLVGVLVTGVVGWMALAIHFSPIPWGWVRTTLAGLFVVTVLVALRWLPRRRTLAGLAAVFIVFVAWWCSIEPSARGDYPPQTAVLNRVEFEGDVVRVRNVRCFEYRTETDFDARREDREYDLREVRTVDLIVSYWGFDVIAHTFLSFGFAGGEQLAVSVEVRREKDEEYDPLQGLFKQFELIYVWGDERDLIRLRTTYRKEDVYLYRTASSPARTRLLLVDMLRRTEELAQRPEFYNTATRNCTSSIIDHVNNVLPHEIPWGHRSLMNGFADRRAFEEGWLESDRGFDETRAAAKINARANAPGDPGGFSRRIRSHLR